MAITRREELALTAKVDLCLGDAVEHEGVTMDGKQLLACEITDKIHLKRMQRLVPGVRPKRADLVLSRQRHVAGRVWRASAVYSLPRVDCGRRGRRERGMRVECG